MEAMNWIRLTDSQPDEGAEVFVYDAFYDEYDVAVYKGDGEFSTGDRVTHWCPLVRPADVAEVKAQLVREQEKANARQMAERLKSEKQANMQAWETPMQCGHAVKHLKIDGTHDYCEICKPPIAEAAAK